MYIEEIECEEDIRAKMIAQALTVEQQNYKFSPEARNRTVLRIKEPSQKARAEVIPDVSISVGNECDVSKRRGRGLYGLHARRNRLAS